VGQLSRSTISIGRRDGVVSIMCVVVVRCRFCLPTSSRLRASSASETFVASSSVSSLVDRSAFASDDFVVVVVVERSRNSSRTPAADPNTQRQHKHVSYRLVQFKKTPSNDANNDDAPLCTDEAQIGVEQQRLRRHGRYRRRRWRRRRCSWAVRRHPRRAVCSMITNETHKRDYCESRTTTKQQNK
jgi:hypothetical protein